MSQLGRCVLLGVLAYCLSVVTASYINCTVGTSNIILSAPHGGYDKPAQIPDRVDGCYTNGACVYEHGCGVPNSQECDVKTLRDSNTLELTQLLASKLEVLTGQKPHVAINNLHRSKMDANRAIDEATFDDPIATTAFNEFHQCLSDASALVQVGNQRGLFVDMHGQVHSHGMVELGYMVIKSRLNNDNPVPKYSSIRSLDSHTSFSFETILRGNQSLGQFLEDEGYDNIPSPSHPKPGEESYFSGGYNTKAYGSRYGGGVDAVQVESHKDQRESQVLDAYAEALAKAIKKFMDIHY